jgi:hypothetical protein
MYVYVREIDVLRNPKINKVRAFNFEIGDPLEVIDSPYNSLCGFTIVQVFIPWGKRRFSGLRISCTLIY